MRSSFGLLSITNNGSSRGMATGPLQRSGTNFLRWLRQLEYVHEMSREAGAVQSQAVSSMTHGTKFAPDLATERPGLGCRWQRTASPNCKGQTGAACPSHQEERSAHANASCRPALVVPADRLGLAVRSSARRILPTAPSSDARLRRHP